MVVPAYNSAGSLLDLSTELETALNEIGRPFELILINDGSVDDSWEVIETLVKKHRWIRAHNLMRNYGQHNALLCGIRSARFDLIATLDDDGQNPPVEIKKLIAELERGYDVVYGTPARVQRALWRTIGSWLVEVILLRIVGAPSVRGAGSFRLFRTRLRDGFADYNSPDVPVDVLLSWSTMRFSAVTVEHVPRAVGTSNYTFRRLTHHALDLLTGFSTLPLHITSWVGLLLTVFGIVLLATYVVHGGNVPRFSFLASIIVTFAGAQLFAIGMIGEYLARMHRRTMGRPAFVITETIGNDDPAASFSD